MPRTRKTKASEQKISLGASSSDETHLLNFRELCIKKKEELLREKELALAKHALEMKQLKLSIPASLGKRTLKQLRQDPNWQTTMCPTKQCSVLSSGVEKEKSSDDGYLTSDTSGGQRQSRSQRRSKSVSGVRPLRSSSRNTRSSSRGGTSSVCSTLKIPVRRSRSASTNSRANRFKTPANTRKLDCFGTVTPKMKPNTPSVVLRRPGQGEIAISLNGSPLMATAMVCETTANINIPLADGRLINIQPTKGLRASEIPELDPEIQRQLEILRANLNSVCQLKSNK